MLLVGIQLDCNPCKPYSKALPILKLIHKISTDSRLIKETI